ncbi:hypothetical protein AAZX31_03G060900 [Glycine max]
MTDLTTSRKIYSLSAVKVYHCTVMVGEELTLHLEDERTWRQWILNVIKGMNHFLGYLCCVHTLADFYVFV